MTEAAVRLAVMAYIAEAEGPQGPVAAWVAAAPSPRVSMLPPAVARALGAELPPAVAASLAAAMELVFHSATVLDDLQDNSARRHGRPAAWIAMGWRQAINAGVLLLAAANLAVAAAGLGAEGQRALARGTGLMARGQWVDVEGRRATLDEMLACGRQKTGGLVGMAMALGGLAVGVGPERAAALADAGALIGEALQLHDDVEDLLERFESGRPCWTALLAAVYPTLPPAGQVTVDEWLTGGASPSPEEMAALLLDHGAAQIGLALARRALGAADRALRGAGLGGEEAAALIGQVM